MNCFYSEMYGMFSYISSSSSSLVRVSSYYLYTSYLEKGDKKNSEEIGAHLSSSKIHIHKNKQNNGKLWSHTTHNRFIKDFDLFYRWSTS